MHTHTHTKSALIGQSPNPTGYNLSEFRLFHSTLLLKKINNKAFCLLPRRPVFFRAILEMKNHRMSATLFLVGMISPVNFYVKQSANISCFPLAEVWDSGWCFSCCVRTHSRVECRSNAVQGFIVSIQTQTYI